MSSSDFLTFMAPYLLIFFGVLVIVCCFLRSCHCGMSAYELKEIRELHEREIRENRMRIRNRLERQRQFEQKQMEDAFVEANLNRLELADALAKYAKYLKQKIKEDQEKEEMEEDDEIIIFVNPGDGKPVLGNLIKNDKV